MFNSFTQSDRDFLLLITGILSRFVEYVRIYETTGIKVKLLSHGLSERMDQLILDNSKIIKCIDSKEFFIAKSKLQHQITLVHSLQKELEEWENSFNTTSDMIQIIFDKVNLIPFDVKDALNVLIENYRLMAEKKNILIRTIDLDKIGILQLDSEKIQRVFYNLFTNAIKYSYDNSTITIQYNRVHEDLFNEGVSKDWVLITFENFGIPVEENEVPQLFDKYFRGKSAIDIQSNDDQKRNQNEGLGLYVVREYMRRHNGDVRLFNKNNPFKIGIYIPFF